LLEEVVLPRERDGEDSDDEGEGEEEGKREGTYDIEQLKAINRDLRARLAEQDNRVEELTARCVSTCPPESACESPC
jgi:predicted RNase H-like nuclease (RuvC/YqgF family)